LHELLAGEPPFKGESLSGVLASIVADPPAVLRRVRPEVPPLLEAIVARCLQKDRSQRYASISDLARALAAFAPPDAQAALQRAYTFAKPDIATQSLSPPHPAAVAPVPLGGSPPMAGLPSPLPPPLVHSDTARGLSRALGPGQERRAGLLAAGVLGVLALLFAYGGYRAEGAAASAPAAAASLAPAASTAPQTPRPSHTSNVPLTTERWSGIEQARGTGTAKPAPAGTPLDDAKLFADRK
jgi:serine/threonine-protein kinase